MYLKSLQLRNFRNYTEQYVDFTAPKTIILGENAQGKSNLIEAVEILSALKSHRTSRDRELIQAHQDAAQIVGNLDRETTGSVELSLTLRANGRRTAALNGLTQRRQMDFLGTLNMVQFSSLDLDLVRGGPEVRRNWLDTLLLQLEPVYASLIQQYTQILRQRNALLKSIKAAAIDPTKLAPTTPVALWDAQLAVAGSHIIRRRDRVITRLLPLAQTWHRAISGQSEELQIAYRPNVSVTIDQPEAIQSQFLAQIQEKRAIERYQGTTLVGPHRDDLDFMLNGTPARQYASQGQQRTLVLALKLAELQLIEDVIGEPPILLLDDVLAELDLNRQNQLLETIQDHFQTLITTTHLGSFDSSWLNASQILHIQAGSLSVADRTETGRSA
jgi:DNA replication and repair protein RecF